MVAIKKLRVSVAILFYAAGALCTLLGLATVIPTVVKLIQFNDLVMVLGAPIFFSGVTICIYGILICGLGRVIQLLDRRPEAAALDVTFDETKTFVRCPKCEQHLRVPKGKKGMLACPACGNKFEAET
jgi:uncharacterized Zn-finger protein